LKTGESHFAKKEIVVVLLHPLIDEDKIRVVVSPGCEMRPEMSAADDVSAKAGGRGDSRV